MCADGVYAVRYRLVITASGFACDTLYSGTFILHKVVGSCNWGSDEPAVDLTVPCNLSTTGKKRFRLSSEASGGLLRWKMDINNFIVIGGSEISGTLGYYYSTPNEARLRCTQAYTLQSFAAPTFGATCTIECA